MLSKPKLAKKVGTIILLSWDEDYLLVLGRKKQHPNLALDASCEPGWELSCTTGYQKKSSSQTTADQRTCSTIQEGCKTHDKNEII